MNKSALAFKKRLEKKVDELYKVDQKTIANMLISKTLEVRESTFGSVEGHLQLSASGITLEVLKGLFVQC